MDKKLHISLLGEFSLTIAGQPVKTVNADRPQTLLAYLLLHRHSPQSRQQLAFTLWPDSAEVQARTNLRNLLHTLRRNLPEADSFLLLDTHTVQWRPDADYWLDVAEFEAAWTLAQQSEGMAQKQQWLETAVSLYKGPLLPHNYDDWILPRREALHMAYREALTQLATLLEETGDYQAALHPARLLQQQDVLDETAVRLLLRLHAKNGDVASIRRVYQNCVARLRQELDAEPSPETQKALAAALQLVEGGAGEEERGEGTAVVLTQRTSPRHAWQLPPQNTPFVGREEELARLAQWLADPTCHLITIIGPGGVGKTRLALQTANGHVAVFAHGAAFITLAALTDPILIPSAIAQGLRFPLNSSTPRHTQLLQYLQDKELLLVLDNMEQFVPHVTFLAELLAAAPCLKLIVTSRQRLHLQEEWVFTLHGLPMPEDQSSTQLAENNAIALFTYLARRYEHTFNPDEAAQAAIARICHLVDGMPLGLELAAAWVRLLTPEEIAVEIEKNLDFLTSSQQNVSDRHRSIRAVFNQSWHMLTEAEQLAFSQLSLFQGGFDREVAEAVAGVTLTMLSDLLDKSLVRRLENGRYDIHELLRQYAADQLAANKARQAAGQSRFATYYLSLAETAAQHLAGPQQQTWLDRLEREYDNLRTALSWAIEAREAETAVQLGAALGRFWWLRYRPLEGGNWLKQILALPGSTTDSHARAMSYAGLLARQRRDYVEAEHWLTQSIQWQRQFGQPLDLGRSLNELGMLFMDRGQFGQAHDLFKEWLEVARKLDFPHGISIALLNLGMIAHHQQAHSQAETYYQESLAIVRQAGLKTNEAMILNSYSILLLEQKQIETAKMRLSESLQLNQALDYKDGLSWAMLGTITLAYKLTQFELAATFVGTLDNLRQLLQSALPPINQAYLEKIINDLRQQLDPQRFAAKYEVGKQMSLAEAVTTALVLCQST